MINWIKRLLYPEPELVGVQIIHHPWLVEDTCVMEVVTRCGFREDTVGAISTTDFSTITFDRPVFWKIQRDVGLLISSSDTSMISEAAKKCLDLRKDISAKHTQLYRTNIASKGIATPMSETLIGVLQDLSREKVIAEANYQEQIVKLNKKWKS